MAHLTPNSPEEAHAPPVAFRDDTGVQDYLEQLGHALTTGDVKTVASLWETPALVLSDNDALAVMGTEQVENFFAGAKNDYNSRGITDTRPIIVRQQWASHRIAIVEVRWPWLDAQGNEIGAETSTYTLRRDENGMLKMRCVVMHGALEPHH